MALLVHCLYFL